MPTWFSWQGNVLILDVHIQPKAAKNEVVGVHGERLKIRIKGPPVDGKANRQLIEFLAETFAVPKRDVVLLAGMSGRDKRLSILAPKHLPSFFRVTSRVD